MKTLTDIKPNGTKHKLPLLMTALAVGVVVIGLTWTVWHYQTRNYAEEVAGPLEKSLAQAGGVKKCTRGDAGRGTDNNRPWYEVYYELPKGRSEAIATIKEIAISNGFNLTQATAASRGPVQVGDAYVNNWLYNTVEKRSPYGDLQSGNIELFFTVNNEGPISLSCGVGAKSVTINSGTNASAVSIQTKLPESKR